MKSNQAPFLMAAEFALISTLSASYAKENAPASKQVVAVASPLQADEALSKLKNGNRRFTVGIVRQGGQRTEDIERLSKSQAPNSVVLS